MLFYLTVVNALVTTRLYTTHYRPIAYTRKLTRLAHEDLNGPQLLLLLGLGLLLLAHLSHHQHYHCPSLLLFSTLNSKDTFSLNPSHQRPPPLPSDCLYGHRTAQWFFFLVFPSTVRMHLGVFLEPHHHVCNDSVGSCWNYASCFYDFVAKSVCCQTVKTVWLYMYF